MIAPGGGGTDQLASQNTLYPRVEYQPINNRLGLRERGHRKGILNKINNNKNIF